MERFAWVNTTPTNQSTNKVATRLGDVKEMENGELMQPRGRALLHPAGPMLLQYAQRGCPVDVGRPWSKEEILLAAERGPHKSALDPAAIAMMHDEVREKVKGGFAEIVYLDEIEHLLGTEEWSHLKL